MPLISAVHRGSAEQQTNLVCVQLVPTGRSTNELDLLICRFGSYLNYSTALICFKKK